MPSVFAQYIYIYIYIYIYMCVCVCVYHSYIYIKIIKSSIDFSVQSYLRQNLAFQDLYFIFRHIIVVRVHIVMVEKLSYLFYYPCIFIFDYKFNIISLFLFAGLQYNKNHYQLYKYKRSLVLLQLIILLIKLRINHMTKIIIVERAGEMDIIKMEGRNDQK